MRNVYQLPNFQMLSTVEPWRNILRSYQGVLPPWSFRAPLDRVSDWLEYVYAADLEHRP